MPLIAGKLNTDGPVHETDIRRAFERMSSRAGADVRIINTPGCAIAAAVERQGFRGGLFVSPDQTVQIALDGEVYNALELARELQIDLRGSESVLPLLYQRLGEGMIACFEGSWAMAIWDARKRVLVLARDQTGTRPLFYTEEGGAVSFASELRGVLDLSGTRPGLRPESVDHYFATLYVPAPHTMLLGMLQVTPGHYVTFANGRPSSTRWFVQAATAPFSGDTIDTWKVECRELLKRSLARRIAGKDRVGYLLSSGTDTAVNCVVASWLNDNPVNSFTLGYRDAPDMDERTAARRTAEHLKTVHREVETDLNCVDALADITRRTGAPMGNPAALIINEIFRQVSGHVDAVVTGDGGNEVFGGLYEYMRVMYNVVELRDPVLKRAVGMLKKSLRQGLRETAVETSVRALKRRLGRDRPAVAGSGMAPWEADLRARGWNPQAVEPLSDEEFRSARDFFLLLESYWTPGNRAKLFTGDFKRQIRGHDSMAFLRAYLRNDPKLHLLQQLMWARLNTYVPYNVLQYVEYNATANGVTPLFPYLDKDFMAYMCRVPIEYVYGRAYRHFMKVCFAPDYLPESLFQKTFRGFNTPIGHWMPSQKWKDLVQDHCSDRAIRERGIFEPRYVRDLVATYYGGRRDMATEHPDYQQNIEWSVWTLVAFEAFCREFL